MKKIFTLAMFVFVTLFTANVSAQVKFGLKGGLNVTSMSFSQDVVDADNRAGFFIGPTVKFSLPLTGLGIDVSALYDQREAKLKGDGDGDKTFKTQAINIPVNLRYGIGLGSIASIYMYAGPQFGFNVGDKKQSLYDDVAEWTMRSSNFSINVGAGVMLVKHLQLSANYNIACGKTGEMKVTDVIGDVAKGLSSRGRSNAWQIGLAYYF